MGSLDVVVLFTNITLDETIIIMGSLDVVAIYEYYYLRTLL